VCVAVFINGKVRWLDFLGKSCYHVVMLSFIKRFEELLKSIAESLRKISERTESKIIIDASDLSYREVKTLMKAVKHGKIKFELGDEKPTDIEAVDLWKQLKKELDSLSKNHR
jgi:hypothetical protein